MEPVGADAATRLNSRQTPEGSLARLRRRGLWPTDYQPFATYVRGRRRFDELIVRLTPLRTFIEP